MENPPSGGGPSEERTLGLRGASGAVARGIAISREPVTRSGEGNDSLRLLSPSLRFSRAGEGADLARCDHHL